MTKRRLLLLCLIAVWLAIWVPPVWAAFRLERADESSPPHNGVNIPRTLLLADIHWEPVQPPPAVPQVVKVTRVAYRPTGSVWDRLAACESGGDWHINTGNGYYGGIQFSLRSWRAVGGQGLPHNASRDEQIHRGEKLRHIQGWGAWPACSRRLGLR